MIEALIDGLLSILFYGICLTVGGTVTLCLILRLIGGLGKEEPVNDLWFMGQRGWWERR